MSVVCQVWRGRDMAGNSAYFDEILDNLIYRDEVLDKLDLDGLKLIAG
jgi:hypothetical protein